MQMEDATDKSRCSTTQGVIARPWTTTMDLKTLGHFTVPSEILAQSLESVCLWRGSYYSATPRDLRYRFHLSRWVSNLLHNIVGKFSDQCLSFYTSELQIALLQQTEAMICGSTRRKGRYDWLSWCFCPMCSFWWETRPPCFHSSAGWEGDVKTQAVKSLTAHFCLSKSSMPALTMSELNGFTLMFRMELLVRDHTLVLCLKAALTCRKK